MNLQWQRYPYDAGAFHYGLTGALHDVRTVTSYRPEFQLRENELKRARVGAIGTQASEEFGRKQTLCGYQRVLEAAGVQFILENGGG